MNMTIASMITFVGVIALALGLVLIDDTEISGIYITGLEIFQPNGGE